MKVLKPKYLTFYLLLLACCSYAQQDANEYYYQSNVKENKHITLTDSNDIHKELLVAQTITKSNPDSALQLANAALKSSQQIAYKIGTANGCFIIGNIFQNRGGYDSSLYFYTKGLIYAKAIKAPTSKFLNAIGNTYFFRGAYNEALSYYQEALKQQSHPIKAKDSIAIYINQALVWKRINAIEQFSEAIQIIHPIVSRINDTALKVYLVSLQADLPINSKDYTKNIAQLEEALELGRKISDKQKVVPILNSLTHIFINSGSIDKAMLYTNEALTILKKYPGNQYDFYHTQHNLGLIYMQLKNFRYAERLLANTYAAVEKIGLTDLILHIEPDLAEVYTENGKHALAYKHLKHYARLKDSILENERKSMIGLWQKNILVEKDNALLNQQLFIGKQKRELAVKNIWIGGIALASFLLCLLLLIGVRSYKRKQKLQKELLKNIQKANEIDQLKAQVKGEETERKRLAIELHDGIGSQLWAIKLNVEHLQQQVPEGQNQQSVGHIYHLLEDASNEVRKTAHNLLPDLLLQEGLSAALASFCNKINMNMAIDIDFLEYGAIPRMNEDVELTLYRMIQELIQNTIKHAKASHLIIQISCTNELLNITVEDDGIGLSELTESEKGLGLEHIRKRVQILNGDFDIRSLKDKGTTVYLEFELPHLL